MISVILLYDFCDIYIIQMIKRDKNIKITSTTHDLLKNYCEKNGLKMFSFVEKLIREKCSNENLPPRQKKDLYQED